ncbi:bifunctional hydroxymethylpyrimidine kinase/phosphomethylpyrimidine kinase [Candidatus Desantisbacteria bacterium]|nr:bifunctional hydroxymethylpyrimidine kinase/phosphomethylpyrimidine kinase [Candidatus Desantisbacteria bacterium]
MKNVLTIAGFDPSGGAGIQADLKTFSALETYGLSVATALTVQNTIGVFYVKEINEEIIYKQLKALMEDIDIHAIKIGVLYNKTIIEKISYFLKEINCPIVILDPVIISKNGFWLLEESALKALIKDILPLLTQINIKNDEDIKQSAKIIKNCGPKYVLVKGVEETLTEVKDMLYDGNEFIMFPSKNLKVHHYLHGTGCTFASAIAAELVKGFSIFESIRSAQNFLNSIHNSPLVIGKGNYHINHLGILQHNADKYSILNELKSAFDKLRNENIADYIPEVRSNFVYAAEGASSLDEVAGFPGRITRIDDTIAYIKAPEFGKSKHMADTIISVMQYFPHLRSAMNIKFSDNIIEACKKNNYCIYEFDRNNETEENKNTEGKTLVWQRRARQGTYYKSDRPKSR